MKEKPKPYSAAQNSHGKQINFTENYH